MRVYPSELIFGFFSACVYLCAGHERGFIFYDLMMPPFEICACVTTCRRVHTHASVNAYTHLVMDGYFNFVCILVCHQIKFILFCPVMFPPVLCTCNHAHMLLCECLSVFKTMQEFIPADQGSNRLF